ncbi:MAG: hypothetical protein KDD34_04050 [Bdellovibrionales bacterium]|nr:hypothetical protein [Bdellovibrionales bacterium]
MTEQYWDQLALFETSLNSETGNKVLYFGAVFVDKNKKRNGTANFTFDCAEFFRLKGKK